MTVGDRASVLTKCVYVWERGCDATAGHNGKFALLWRTPCWTTFAGNKGEPGASQSLHHRSWLRFCPVRKKTEGRKRVKLGPDTTIQRSLFFSSSTERPRLFSGAANFSLFGSRTVDSSPPPALRALRLGSFHESSLCCRPSSVFLSTILHGPRNFFFRAKNFTLIRDNRR